jgi:hypothetical protein
MIPFLKSLLNRWTRFGAGAGIVPRGEDLYVTLVRARNAGPQVEGTRVIVGAMLRPAAEWGREYAEFLQQHQFAHVAATVVLPPEDVTMRCVAMPGVKREDLAGAMPFALEGQHPWREDDVQQAWHALEPGHNVLAVMARRERVAQMAALFQEAGVRVAAFVDASSAVYSAVRLYREEAPTAFLAAAPREDGLIDLYGESAARPVFAAAAMPEYAIARATAELRLPPETAAQSLRSLLPPCVGAEPRDLAGYAAALMSAVPAQSLPVNLLPEEQRSSSSRSRLIPTFAILGFLLLGVLSLLGFREFEDRRIMARLEEEYEKLAPQVQRSEAAAVAAKSARDRSAALRRFRQRTTRDLDALLELTRAVDPPGWAQQLDLLEDRIVLAGEAQGAETLLQRLEESGLFRKVEFQSPLLRGAFGGDIFRIRAEREEGKPTLQAGAPVAAPTPKAAAPVVMPPNLLPGNSFLNQQAGGVR